MGLKPTRTHLQPSVAHHHECITKLLGHRTLFVISLKTIYTTFLTLLVFNVKFQLIKQLEG